MLKIYHSIVVNDFNGSFDSKSFPADDENKVIMTEKGLPQIFDQLLREDSTLGRRLREAIRSKEVTLDFKLIIGVHPKRKSKKRGTGKRPERRQPPVPQEDE